MPKRHKRRFTAAEICSVVGAASIAALMMLAAVLEATHAAEAHGATAGAARLENAVLRYALTHSAMPRDLNRDGITSTAETVAQLKDCGLLPHDYSPLDPWGQRYMIVLRPDYSVSLEAGADDVFRLSGGGGEYHASAAPAGV